MKTNFLETLQKGYTFSGDTLVLGGAMFENETQTGSLVQLPLRTLNRHGLIAGATGTGKTKTLQMMAEQLSLLGISSLVMDIKGDLSGVAMPGTTSPRLEERQQKIGLPVTLAGSPVEFLSLSDQPGVRLRATVTEFGPVLFSRILDLSEVQTGVVSVVFKYADDHKLPLLDLEDFKKTLQYMTNEGREEAEKAYGQIASSSVGTILRKVLALEQQGAATFFGEPSFEVRDLCRVNDQGLGYVSVLRLNDIQDKPGLFSTFMMSLLAEIYSTFPERGDADRPELMLFIDEAHLIFANASDELLDQIESIIKLIRSKGVGIFFITQTPTDIPEAVLGQLGLKVQHALRAFTAKDRQGIKLAVQNFPETSFYDLESLITEMGIGEALVTGLNEKGIPTPLVHTMMRGPQSRMDILTDEEIAAINNRSAMVKKYNQAVERDSALEILSAKIEEAQEEAHQAELKAQQEKARETSSRGGGRREKTVIEQIAANPMARQIGRTVARELTRGLLGVLGIGGGSRKRR
ncbi:MAG: helicase HerA-like domain-containing protein [Bacteroidia bacterium]|nr:helicase HerA-like domain-containing protein [Bacteroidia bacterium]